MSLAGYTPFLPLYIWFAAVLSRFAALSAVNAAERDSSSVEQAGTALDKWGDAVLRLAYSYLHNMEDAEDILQDTLVQYMRKAPVFESAEHEKAWLLRVASNLAKNRIKYNRIRRTDELSEELVAQSREDLSFVWDAVKALPEKYRAVIHLFYQEGLQTARIAEILQERETTIRSRLSRARTMLQDTLREAYDFGV